MKNPEGENICKKNIPLIQWLNSPDRVGLTVKWAFPPSNSIGWNGSSDIFGVDLISARLFSLVEGFIGSGEKSFNGIIGNIILSHPDTDG